MTGQPHYAAAIVRECPICGCSYFDSHSVATADIPRAWQDENGVWFHGPAQETQIRTCAGCSWSQTLTFKRGKLVTTHTSP